MKVDYVSDLHVNHYVPFIKNQIKWEKRTKEWSKELFQTGKGDILVIAGDFSEWNRQSVWVLEEASEHYDDVLIVVGNHDYYLLSGKQRKAYKTSLNRVEEFFQLASQIPNLTVLDKSVVTVNGVTFAGDSLWYDIKTPEDERFFNEVSNDSKFIYTGIPYKASYEVLHQASMEWYQTLENEDVDVFISHVPPLHPPVSPHKRNACYDTPVPFLVGKHWVCGHQHVRGVFSRGGVTFHMNALGYPSETRNEVLMLHSFDV